MAGPVAAVADPVDAMVARDGMGESSWAAVDAGCWGAGTVD